MSATRTDVRVSLRGPIVLLRPQIGPGAVYDEATAQQLKGHMSRVTSVAAAGKTGCACERLVRGRATAPCECWFCAAGSHVISPSSRFVVEKDGLSLRAFAVVVGDRLAHVIDDNALVGYLYSVVNDADEVVGTTVRVYYPDGGGVTGYSVDCSTTLEAGEPRDGERAAQTRRKVMLVFMLLSAGRGRDTEIAPRSVFTAWRRPLS
jgi:hypothetical protein